jgi:FAD-dependent urate hydroxylase
VTLLGDAAHTMPPILAQGTNQALLDTMVLRKALSDFRNPPNGSNGGLSSALRWYEKTRRRRLSVVSWVTSRQMSQSESVLKPATMISDSFGTWAMTTFLRWLSHRRISADVDRDLSNRFVRS